jgi:hypothetical protein
MSHLTDNDRQALELARDLRANMQQWQARHGMNGTFSISPFVDPKGRPSVIVTMDSPLALAMVRSLDQQAAHGPAPLPPPAPLQAPVPPPAPAHQHARHFPVPTQALG